MTDRYPALLPLTVAGLVLLLAGWIYWPGQYGPALLDDRSSVLVISDLKENPDFFWDYVTGNNSGPLGRPVSMVSFALEQLFLDGSLATSKRVSIFLHLFNGSLVICLFWLLFRHIATPGYRWLAVALGAAWLLSPLYVSTVLYIVQRMAMICTTFMLSASIGYVLWRERLGQGRFSMPLFSLVVVSAILGVFAKENAIVLVPLLLLTEAFWFQFAGVNGRRIPWLQWTTLGLIALGTLLIAVYLIAGYEARVAAFRHRPFTLDERLLTEARVVWHYVAQVYIPNLSGMGLYHDDVVVSTSLNSPASTKLAVGAWLGVVLLSLALIRWRYGRYLVLGIAWFLVGHSIESTVFSLELYFEHRNYFPGIGLLLVVGTLYALLVRRWPAVKAPLLAYLACYVVWLATLTSSQVQVWSSHPLLILQHLNGHPDSFRANTDMAVQMAILGQLDAAQTYSARAFAVSDEERSGDHDIRDLALACIANKPVQPSQMAALGTANPERPFGTVDTVHLLVRMLQDNSCPEFDRLGFANRMAQIYLSADSPATASANLYRGLAVLENALQRWDNALAYIDLFLTSTPDSVQGLLMKLHFVNALGKVEPANAVRSRLLELQDQGKLTVGEQQTLSLYLEN